jgi:hypothetical protein
MKKSIVDLRAEIKADFDALESRLSKKIVETIHRQTMIIGAMIFSSFMSVKDIKFKSFSIFNKVCLRLIVRLKFKHAGKKL